MLAHPGRGLVGIGASIHRLVPEIDAATEQRGRRAMCDRKLDRAYGGIGTRDQHALGRSGLEQRDATRDAARAARRDHDRIGLDPRIERLPSESMNSAKPSDQTIPAQRQHAPDHAHHSVFPNPVERDERDSSEQLRPQPRRLLAEQPDHRQRGGRTEQAAEQRIERDPPLEQPGDLHVGRSEHVEHGDRVAMRVEPAARGEQHDDRRRGRHQHHQRDGEPGDRVQERADRRKPLRVPVDLRRRRNRAGSGADALDSAASPEARSTSIIAGIGRSASSPASPSQGSSSSASRLRSTSATRVTPGSVRTRWTIAFAAASRRAASPSTSWIVSRPAS
ncbi:hypothetical protein DdX_19894 [Ditylenchus destructor]|uniref:Uncharacterized protein n=1 Tax=Ditylenchus destructor TaxID=166010 RepID=A0AAD4MH84_9BILA|nr:hypothetical protein DdX_19894 [Ditylenchus destructor]